MNLQHEEVKKCGLGEHRKKDHEHDEKLKEYGMGKKETEDSY